MDDSTLPSSSTPEPSASSPAKKPTPSILELDLAFLVLWSTGCAVYFAIARQWLSDGPQAINSGGAALAVGLVILCVLAVLTGAGWAGTLVVSFHLFNATRITIPAGAWLLYSLGIIQTADLASSALPADSSFSAQAIRIGVNMLAFTLPTLSRRMSPAWTRLFFALAIAQLLPLVSELMPSKNALALVNTARVAIVSLLVVYAVVQPGRKETRRRLGWLHGVGVVCLSAWMLAPLWH